MKTLATLLALLLLASCASSNDGFIDDQTTSCAAGSEIQLQAGFAETSESQRIQRRVTFLVEITNLSDDEISVASVSADPAQSRSRERYTLQGATREIGKTIAEGESTIVEIPMDVRLREHGPYDLPDPSPVDLGREVSEMFDVSVTVRLEDGAAHRCRFRVPATF